MYMMSRSSSSMGNGDNENVEEEATTEETKSFFQIPIHCESEYTRLHQSFSQYSLYTLVSESHGSHGISFPSSGSRQYEQSSLYHWIVMNYRNVTPDHLYTNLLFPKLSLLLPSKNMTDVNRIAESKIRIERMASLYSKNRDDSHGHGIPADGGSTGRHPTNRNSNPIFVTDTDRKHQLASLEIRTAVTKYLLPSYHQLEALATKK